MKKRLGTSKVDISNRKFGRLSVIKVDNSPHKSIHWICRCRCGNVVSVGFWNLINKAALSCGCLRSELTAIRNRLNAKHGMCQSTEFKIWDGMIQRCTNPGSNDYSRYGGRGIKMCRRWRTSFTAFYMDMGPRPKGKTLDRKNNDGDYKKSNCRWATEEEQHNNTRTNVHVQFQGRTQTIAQWAREIGRCPKMLRYRLKHWSVKRALTAPKENYQWRD